MIRTNSTLRIAAFAMLALLADGSRRASAEDFYYVLVFGSQSHPKQLRYTHTWATFVHAQGTGLDPDNYTIEAHTISWLPESLNVRVWALRPEPGVNLDLEQTLAYVLQNGESVTLWGPFRVDPRAWERSLFVRRVIDSGIPRYRAISTAYDLTISDCIHAVAAVDPEFGREHYPLIRVGKPASRYIAREIVTRSGFDQYANDNAWLIPRLGLDRYPIQVVRPTEIPKRPCVLCRCPE